MGPLLLSRPATVPRQAQRPDTLRNQQVRCSSHPTSSKKHRKLRFSVLFFASRKPLAGRVVQKRLLPMRKNKTPSVIVEMRSGNCKLQNKGRPFKNEVAETV